VEDSAETGRITFRDVFAVGEFRAMWLAELLSFMGDQLARVALAVLVFDRTGSAALTGLTYALTYIPTVVGALALSAIADRRPRRHVIVAVDTIRTLVVAAMVIPGVGLPVLCGLVAVMSFLGGPYKAAQLALLRDVLDTGRYPAGMAVRQITTQTAQLLGFASGGILSAALSPQVCLGIDAVTFAASALLIGRFVRSRPAARSSSAGHSLIAGTKVVWNEPRRRAIFLTTVLGLFYIAPQGIAAPYVAQLGYGPAMVGFVLASTGAGAIIGLSAFSRFVPAARRRTALPVACLAAGLPLVLVLAHAGVYVAMIVFAVSNALWCSQVVMSVSFLAELLPDDQRAQGMGVASSTNLTAQGLGTGLAGLLAQATSPTSAIALSGAVSVLVALWPSALWIKSTRRANTPTEVSNSPPLPSAAQ
jgi:predicted MFS family arabinose efflux permease